MPSLCSDKHWSVSVEVAQINRRICSEESLGALEMTEEGRDVQGGVAVDVLRVDGSLHVEQPLDELGLVTNADHVEESLAEAIAPRRVRSLLAFEEKSHDLLVIRLWFL